MRSDLIGVKYSSLTKEEIEVVKEVLSKTKTGVKVTQVFVPPNKIVSL